jgi:hypothetical protein
MREKFAILFCAVTVLAALLLSMAFATRHNPPAASPPPAKGASAPKGKAIFQELGCASCNSFAGAGNPRLPLNGAAERWNDRELRDWITGEGAATNKLSPTILKRKRAYRTLPDDQMTLLIDYLRGRSR